MAVSILTDGSLTGQEVKDYYKEFFYKYATKAFKQL
jgi:hypothetical protein